MHGGPFGIIEDLGDLGGAAGRVEFPAYGGPLRLAGLQLITAGQQCGAAALPVRQLAGAGLGGAGGVALLRAPCAVRALAAWLDSATAASSWAQAVVSPGLAGPAAPSSPGSVPGWAPGSALAGAAGWAMG